MNDKPIISVILPVYNQEKYLSKCLESIIKQTFDDFEVLLIDDGSFDSSPQLCDSWKEKDCRIRVFHTKNGGVSSARNYGIDQSRGEYIVFIDPDDYVASNYLLDLLELLPIEGDGNGFVVQGYEKIYDDSGVIEKKVFQSCRYSSADIATLLKSKELGDMFSPWAKLFKRCFLNQYNLRFESSLKYFEDVLFILNCIYCSEYIIVGNSTDYCYMLRSGTLSKNIGSFDLECQAFCLCNKMIKSLAEKYHIMYSDIQAPVKLLCFPFSRALKADYHELDCILGNMRRQHLALLKENALEYMRYYYAPDYLTDKIGRFLLIYNWIWLYDILFFTLFKLKVKKMFCPAI